MSEKKHDVAKRVIVIIRSVAGMTLIAATIIAVAIASYALWDIKDMTSKALPDQYEKYKPGASKYSFEELVAMNPEVFGWIDIYGTNIDYPVLQGDDNEKYVSTSPMGTYSVSGSIFLDYRNKKDFSDFNNIIYGHSMSYNAMFGDVCDFKEEKFYNEHKYGDLYFDGRHHGLRIIGFVETDAYKSGLYRPDIRTDKEKNEFFEELDKDSKYVIAETDKNTGNTYVLLSTCTSAMTNGRDVLVCVLTEEVYADPFANDAGNKDTVEGPRMRLRFILIILIIIAILSIIATVIRKADKRRAREAEEKCIKESEKEKE